ncbi:hypothetical protein [Halomicrobium sp. LC1Hm]|uniref:hypothetical protein n=1 Tax=Halomicrobium sp. LC1Hm TaxID=2610902 RepID=UPI0012982C16|nr:hypothetical protein [Halomicrobium sp. LC1Hm]QGA83876.1 putative membrane protein [Halomicrobium sp. LC1Hm]
MPSTDRFETKRGECRIENEELVLDESRLKYLESLYSGYWQADEWWRKIVFLGIVLAVPTGVASIVLSALDGSLDTRTVAVGLAVIVGLVAALQCYQRWVRGFTSRSTIPLDAITTVSFERGTLGITRPRFVVRYETADEESRRYILLPSLSMPHGEDVVARAQKVLEDHGIEIES